MAWHRVMAIGCSHGELVHPGAMLRVMEFRHRFQPEIRFHLGDLIDTAAFRSGAGGTKDEARRPRDDRRAALQFINEYEPTHLAWGNHDWRLYELREHPKAIVAELASDIWDELNDALAKLHTQTVPYDVEDGWFFQGGVMWGHGFMFSENAVRDHAEMLGAPVVMAHKHTPQQVQGRTREATHSFCVGAIADDRQLSYGRRRRASLTHGHGIVYGEMSEASANLFLLQAKNGEEIPFPPNL